MPFFLRKVSKAKWYRSQAEQLLADGDVPADAVGDLRSTGNRLSLWQVDDDKADLPRVIAALASLFQRPAEFDYCLFPVADVSAVGLSVQRCAGDTKDAAANQVLHFDLIDLTGKGLISLATIIFGPSVELVRVPANAVIGHLADAIRNERFAIEDLQDSIKPKVAAQLTDRGR